MIAKLKEAVSGELLKKVAGTIVNLVVVFIAAALGVSQWAPSLIEQRAVDKAVAITSSKIEAMEIRSIQRHESTLALTKYDLLQREKDSKQQRFFLWQNLIETKQVDSPYIRMQVQLLREEWQEAEREAKEQWKKLESMGATRGGKAEE